MSIHIKDVKKIYVNKAGVETPALNGISLEVKDKDFCAIAGPSGSGKSTLLNLLGCLDKPSSGCVIYDQTDIATMRKNELATFRLNHIGFVFQSYNLIPTLTAIENVEYIMLLQGISPQERLKKSQEILIRVGLDGQAHKYPNQMSGGQQQRVAVARAIVAQPDVILADEPTANLDSKTSQNLLQLMLELNEEKGMTFIFSTHDPMLMEQVKTIFHIKDGVIQP